MDPGETIRQAVEREVMEETGIQSNFLGIIGLRETLEARYSASDLYLVCLMECSLGSSTEINIIDKREVFQAKWVPLEELFTNTEGECKYRLFPNAWKFMSCLNKRFQLYKEG